MRVTFFLLSFFIFLAAFLWLTFSGALLVLGFILWLSLLVITVGYSDSVTLFLLGARELRSSDEAIFFEAVAQEAYKLAVPMPHLYFYNGILERGFILQSQQRISLVLNKALLDSSSPDELSAVCFELLLQVKKGMAPKRTKTMFLLGTQSWLAHSLVGLLLTPVPVKEVKESANCFLNYLIHPWLRFVFKLTLGNKYFVRLQNLLTDFPKEEELIKKLGQKIMKNDQCSSLPSRKLIELSSYNRSLHYQNILALEFLPHEWDFLFSEKGMSSVEKT